MIDITVLKYDLILLTPKGVTYHLFEPQRELSWEEQPDELAVRLQFQINNMYIQGSWLHKLLTLGSQIYLYCDWGTGWNEIFRGTIYNTDSNYSALDNLTITVYDQLRQLKQTKDELYYSGGTTGSTIIRDTAARWNIPLDKVEGPNVGLAKMPVRGQYIADIWNAVIKESKSKGAAKYIIRSIKGKTSILLPGNNTPIYHFGSDDNIQQVRDQQDIEDLVTRVKIVGNAGDNERRPFIAQRDGRTEFGLFQEIVERNNEEPGKAQQEAVYILNERGQPRKNRTLQAPDLPFLRRGDKIHVTAGSLNGYYLISGIQHQANSKSMHLQLEDI